MNPIVKRFLMLLSFFLCTICCAQEADNQPAGSQLMLADPFILKKDGKYFLTYSCNDYRNQDYAVGYAVSDSPMGPWTKYEGNPILLRPQDYVGTGHHAFFKDAPAEESVVDETSAVTGSEYS